VAIKGASGCPEKIQSPINASSTRNQPIAIRLVAVVDPARHFCRWSGIEPHALRLSIYTEEEIEDVESPFFHERTQR
jgi:hypothetical protein